MLVSDSDNFVAFESDDEIGEEDLLPKEHSTLENREEITISTRLSTIAHLTTLADDELSKLIEDNGFSLICRTRLWRHLQSNPVAVQFIRTTFANVTFKPVRELCVEFPWAPDELLDAIYCQGIDMDELLISLASKFVPREFLEDKKSGHLPRWELLDICHTKGIDLVDTVSVDYHTEERAGVLERWIGRCSWCQWSSVHVITQKNVMRRNVYTCLACLSRTVACRNWWKNGCQNLARGHATWDEEKCMQCSAVVQEWEEAAPSVIGRCDWCQSTSTHALVRRGFGTLRSSYRCITCARGTLPCRTKCGGFSRSHAMFDDDKCTVCLGVQPEDRYLHDMYCSWCTNRVMFKLEQVNRVARNVYSCENCTCRGVRCSQCKTGMARSSPGLAPDDWRCLQCRRKVEWGSLQRYRIFRQSSETSLSAAQRLPTSVSFCAKLPRYVATPESPPGSPWSISSDESDAASLRLTGLSSLLKKKGVAIEPEPTASDSSTPLAENEGDTKPEEEAPPSSEGSVWDLGPKAWIARRLSKVDPQTPPNTPLEQQGLRAVVEEQEVSAVEGAEEPRVSAAAVVGDSGAPAADTNDAGAADASDSAAPNGATPARRSVWDMLSSWKAESLTPATAATEGEGDRVEEMAPVSAATDDAGSTPATAASADEGSDVPRRPSVWATFTASFLAPSTPEIVVEALDEDDDHHDSTDNADNNDTVIDAVNDNDRVPSNSSPGLDETEVVALPSPQPARSLSEQGSPYPAVSLSEQGSPHPAVSLSEQGSPHPVVTSSVNEDPPTPSQPTNVTTPSPAVDSAVNTDAATLTATSAGARASAGALASDHSPVDAAKAVAADLSGNTEIPSVAVPGDATAASLSAPDAPAEARRDKPSHATSEPNEVPVIGGEAPAHLHAEGSEPHNSSSWIPKTNVERLLALLKKDTPAKRKALAAGMIRPFFALACMSTEERLRVASLLEIDVVVDSMKEHAGYANLWGDTDDAPAAGLAEPLLHQQFDADLVAHEEAWRIINSNFFGLQARSNQFYQLFNSNWDEMLIGVCQTVFNSVCRKTPLSHEESQERCQHPSDSRLRELEHEILEKMCRSDCWLNRAKASAGANETVDVTLDFPDFQMPTSPLPAPEPDWSEEHAAELIRTVLAGGSHPKSRSGAVIMPPLASWLNSTLRAATRGSAGNACGLAAREVDAAVQQHITASGTAAAMAAAGVAVRQILTTSAQFAALEASMDTTIVASTALGDSLFVASVVLSVLGTLLLLWDVLMLLFGPSFARLFPVVFLVTCQLLQLEQLLSMHGLDLEDFL